MGHVMKKLARKNVPHQIEKKDYQELNVEIYFKKNQGSLTKKI